MTTYCEACGASWSDDYARVFGDNEGRLRGCPSCQPSGRGAMGYGAGAGMDPEQRKGMRGVSH